MTTTERVPVVLTSEEAADRVKVSEDYMMRLFRAELVDATDHGGSIGWRTTDVAVDAWVAAGMPKPPPRKDHVRVG